MLKHKEQFCCAPQCGQLSAQKQSNSRLLTIISLMVFSFLYSLYKDHGKTSSRSHQKASTKATATHNRAPIEFAFAGEKTFALYLKIL
jgi:hypothetical protein